MGPGHDGNRDRAIQGGHHSSLHDRMADGRVRARACCGQPIRRAFLLPLRLPAWGGSFDFRPPPHVPLAHAIRNVATRCHHCETVCPVGAIKQSGEINMNECFYCLDCQVPTTTIKSARRWSGAASASSPQSSPRLQVQRTARSLSEALNEASKRGRRDDAGTRPERPKRLRRNRRCPAGAR